MANNSKVALITGANRGLGLETARQLGKKNVTIVAAARTLKSAEETAAKLQAEGIDAVPVKLEVTDANDREAVAKLLAEKYGKLDILINNAGVSGPGGFNPGKPSETKEEDLKLVLATNLFAVMALTRTLLPLLQKSAGGRIVNLSSILGSQTLHADPKSPIYDFKALSYNLSKTALNMYTIHLAYELKDTTVKVNSVHPGWVKTDMGTDAAPMEIPEGAQTSVELALIGADGPNGRFIHLGQELPW